MRTPPHRTFALCATALSLLAICPLPAYSAAAAPLGFIDDQPLRSDLLGALQGMVKFAQTHTIDPAGNAANEMPTLVAEREALVMFTPLEPIAETSMGQVKVKAMRDGVLLGERLLAPPRLLPDADRDRVDERPDVRYSLKAWSAQLPWEWLKPGLSLQFTDGQRSGSLGAQAIEFSGPAELVVQTIRLGMLTDPLPASANWFETQPGVAAIDYFQKIPVARLTVGQYLPLHLDRVVLPNGTVYTTASADQGGVYSGDMRDLGKALISTGINLANYGIVDSAGSSQEQPGYFRETVVHQNIGRYANGIVRHGLSGGNGIATLIDTTGNEFSHELGHGYGLGHFPGGGFWSSHNAKSGWGYDGFRNRMLSNLRWSTAAADNVIEGAVTPPFKALYRYRQDPMAGGSAEGSLSKLTHHTGYTMKRVQQALVGSSQVDANSPTGYLRWDASKQALVTATERTRPALFGVPVVTLVGYYDPLGQLPSTVYPALYGNFGHTYNLPAPQANGGCYLSVQTAEQGAGQVDIKLAASRYSAVEMNKFHVNLPASLQPTRATVYCVIDGQRRELAVGVIDKPTAPLPAAIRVGKEDGYLSAALQLPNVRAALPQRFSSTADFEARLRDVYGDVHNWNDTRAGRVGTLYGYDNIYTGLREYFILKTPRYGYFPTDGSSNDSWRYMGKAEDSVTWSPEPLRALKTVGHSLSEKVLAYYGVTALKEWVMYDTTAQRGQVYQYYNPYTNLHEYFMARSSRYWYFPTDATSNPYWIYLGNDASMKAAFYPASAVEVDQQLSHWYQQDALRSWGAPTTAGVVGDVYRYAYRGRVDYFRLKVENYWYFPIDQTSNDHWEYLGTAP